MTIIEIIGYIGLLLGCIGLTLKKDIHLLFTLGASNMLMGIHYLLLGHIAGAYTLFFDAFKNIITPYSQQRNWIYFLLALGTIGVGYVGYTGNFYSLFPGVASLLWTTLTFYLTGVKMRLGVILVGLTWISYNIIIGSTPGVITSILFFISNLVGIYKLLTKKHV